MKAYAICHLVISFDIIVAHSEYQISDLNASVIEGKIILRFKFSKPNMKSHILASSIAYN